ncbi:uncharacterized protein DUF1707 [Murinocardiopsis flavida]|uniref:Uncharacterized protein DUF1707 n=1 Tax=Murinocardiopsis flavida TaxID=645275 RepID=A0A2P8D523_9ACTN|nr:DUF1707 domain-containing protein [Murinocardiopsis flavida]PSK92315.1 uncharacterized protein DUF1707 [Murinocardiopsis flavida]
MSPDRPDDQRSMRASDSDRERVSEILREAAAEGRITLDELDDRLDRNYRARTYADLEPITEDLPVPRETGANVARTAPAGRVEPTGETLELKAKAGTIARRGNWRVPGSIVVANPYGDTRLNFREATFESSVVEIDLTASWGEAKFVLPDGASAEIDVDTSWFGSVDSRVPEVRTGPAPHFKITGSVKGGSLKVRYKMRLDDWLSWEE